MKNKTAIWLSLLLPGLGHLYLKRYFDGIAISAAAILVWVVEIHLASAMPVFSGKALVITGALIFLYLYALADVYKRLKQTTQ
ncbi:MAG: hypothetical protein ABH867_03065 [Patescibacteria group bacterium]|nr:hypothetical protein [Patescibacteria group bacterium]